MIESTNGLMRRILRFLNHHSELYIKHRQNGEFSRAVDSLRRVQAILRLVDQAERAGKCQLSWNDWASIQLARRHVDIMFHTPADAPGLLSEPSRYSEHCEHSLPERW